MTTDGEGQTRIPPTVTREIRLFGDDSAIGKMVVLEASLRGEVVGCGLIRRKGDPEKDDEIPSANNMNATVKDFDGLEINDAIEVTFFAHPAWKDISECDAQIRVPAKVAPCEF